MFSLSQLSIGNTPLIKNVLLNQQVEIPELYLKLEQNNPADSHKIRSLSYQLSKCSQNNPKIFALSSTGNAAIAANLYVSKKNLKIITFITPNISSSKLSELEKISPYLIVTERPYRMLSYLQHRYNIPSLNALLDDNSIVAYEKIGTEIYEQQPQTKNIFVFISSGSTFLGIAQSFLEFKKENKIKSLPRLFAVFLPKTKLKGVYKSAILLNQKYKLAVFEERKKRIKKMLKIFQGKTVEVNDQEIQQARNLLCKFQQDTSPEGCANFAAVMKNKLKINKDVTVCLLTGKANQWETETQKETTKISSLPVANAITDLDEILEKFNLLS